MIIVGELINASRNSIRSAIEKEDSATIKKIAVDQFKAGADYIDVNAGIFIGKEPSYLSWLVKQVQKSVDAPCTIDSPDPEAIQAALEVHKGIPMINSISLEKERYDKLISIISGTNFKIIALCMSDEGMPETSDQRLSIADKLVNNLVKNNIPLENIYVDPLVQPIATDSSFGIEFLDSVQKIMSTFQGIHTICGLSNISYGLPARSFMNEVFITMAISRGLNSAIINPLDTKMMANITVAETLIGRDDFCMNYLVAFRSGKFEF